MKVTCTWPKDTPDGPVLCGQKVQVVYTNGKLKYPRCRQHDTKTAVGWAEEHGYERVVLA